MPADPRGSVFVDALAHLDVVRARAARLTPPGARRVLEAGCGDGAFLAHIPKQAGRLMVGVDRRKWGTGDEGSAFAEASADKRGTRGRVGSIGGGGGAGQVDGLGDLEAGSPPDSTRHSPFSLVIADVSRLPFRDGVFDAAFCVNTLQVLDARRARRAVGELARAARPGGQVVVTFPNRENPLLRWRMWRWPALYQRWGNPHAFRASDVLRRLRDAGAEPTGVEAVRVPPYASRRSHNGEISHQGTKAQRRIKEINRIFPGDLLVSWCLGGKFAGVVTDRVRRWMDRSPRRAPQLLVTAVVRRG